jgi:cytoplasmic iron level regulating protein YaaA (DUF328/UPF0246 family)
MIILLHSSKTMKSPRSAKKLRQPELIDRARELAAYLATLTSKELEKSMHVSTALAAKTHGVLLDWTDAPEKQSVAMDSFVGDIYSGLRAGDLSESDRAYADEHLRILSGLYGILRPLDGICPYRLEMGYRLPDAKYTDLYKFWGESIVRTLPDSGPVINLSSVEYSRTVTPFVAKRRVVSPKFLTVSPETGEPEFVVVHAKIARGAFARWLITSRAGVEQLHDFKEIGYRYDPRLSTPEEPAFVCDTFEGKGRSVRLQPQ